VPILWRSRIATKFCGEAVTFKNKQRLLRNGGQEGLREATADGSDPHRKTAESLLIINRSHVFHNDRFLGSIAIEVRVDEVRVTLCKAFARSGGADPAGRSRRCGCQGSYSIRIANGLGNTVEIVRHAEGPEPVS